SATGQAARVPTTLAPPRRAVGVYPRPFPFVRATERNCLMNAYLRSLVTFLTNEDGPTAVEYAVMLALIVVVCIGAITALGSNANTTFASVGTAISSSS